MGVTCQLTQKKEWETPHPSERAAPGTQLQPRVTWVIPISGEILDVWVFI